MAQGQEEDWDLTGEPGSDQPGELIKVETREWLPRSVAGKLRQQVKQLRDFLGRSE